MSAISPTSSVGLTVRYFAAAREAAGADAEVLELSAGSTVADAIDELSSRSDALHLLLQKCSFLCDGRAVRDRHTVLRADQTLDVLPPFAGG